MSITETALRLDEAIEHARDILKAQIIDPLSEETRGPVIQIGAEASRGPMFQYWPSGQAYRDEACALSGPISEFTQESLPFDRAELLIWLFGIEWIEHPNEVYDFMSRAVRDEGVAVIAAECPWPGKILCEGKWGEYTDEEIGAAMTRAGFSRLAEVVNRVTFKVWHASRKEVLPRTLMEAEQYLKKGDWASAENVLNGFTDPLNTKEAILEYCLLVAAHCDLAGRQNQAIEALTEALKIDPNCARAMCGLGRISALRRDFQTAAEFFDSALNTQPAFVAALFGQAAVYEARGELDAAYDLISKAALLRPQKEEFLVDLARLGQATGRQVELQAFLKAHLSSDLASGVPAAC